VPRGRWPRLQAANAHPAVKSLFAVCLVFAIFAGNALQVVGLPDVPANSVFGTLMVVVLALFIVELVMNWLTDPFYPCSFFFWMDMLGTASTAFEIAFLYGSDALLAETTVDPMILRTARIAKTAARAGRFLKITKCFQIMVTRQAKPTRQHDTARQLSTKLTLALSTKVSLLTILLVILVPTFKIGQYPEEDLSMKGWGRQLEQSYRDAYDTLQADLTLSETAKFAEVVEEMMVFYRSVTYFPYRLQGYQEDVIVANRSARILGAGLLKSRAAPVRRQNIRKQFAPECLLLRADCNSEGLAAVYFNFERSNRVEAGMEMLVSCFVILVMAVMTSDLSHTVDRLVVKPLERMLGTVREIASTIMGLFPEHIAASRERDDGDAAETCDETVLLERAFDKLSSLSAIYLQEKAVDDELMEDICDESKGVIVDLMMMERKQRQVVVQKTSTAEKITARATPHAVSSADDLPALPVELPFDKAIVESWALNLLGTTTEEKQKLTTYIFFDSAIGRYTGTRFAQVNLFNTFFGQIASRYNDKLPYHNFTHAVDVLHVVYRLLQLTFAKQWVPDVEMYALLVAALAHDIGHPGRTNPFLVEVGHELALKYNDASPLENMHCATLFDILSNSSTDIFKNLAAEGYKRARKVCVGTILHTDNALHFDMVKDLAKAYEVSTEHCERQALNGDDLLPLYRVDVLKKDSLLYLKLFLHLSDVSNPLRPFDICKPWAWCVLEEFFDQGDEEKRLGIPVGMLHDRDVVNKPGSQHGFINFLVAPLVFATIRIFPCLHPLAHQMAVNLQEWRNIWAAEVRPEAEALAKKDSDVKKATAIAEEFRARCSQVSRSSVMMNSISSHSNMSLSLSALDSPRPSFR